MEWNGRRVGCTCAVRVARRGGAISSATRRAVRRAERDIATEVVDRVTHAGRDRTLPDRQRVALVLRYYGGLPLDEIADRDGLRARHREVDAARRARACLSSTSTTRSRRWSSMRREDVEHTLDALASESARADRRRGGTDCPRQATHCSPATRQSSRCPRGGRYRRGGRHSREQRPRQARCRARPDARAPSTPRRAVRRGRMAVASLEAWKCLDPMQYTDDGGRIVA